jgi:MarR family transcriptional regulator, transcriptional regulator for hemolysin
MTTSTPERAATEPEHTGPEPQRAVPDLSFMLAHASHVLATRMTAAFAEIGITPREYCVLNHATGGELTQIELARLSDLDKTTMVVTLDDLEEAGYAERRPSRADRRARVVVVTDEGRRLVAAGTEIADRVHREVLAELAPTSQGVFVDSLAHLVGGLLAEPVESERPVRRARRAAG